MTRDQLQALVRTIPDFPKPGIQFRDISTLLADGPGFAASIDALTHIALPYKPDRIVAIDARGFLFGAPVAVALGAGVIPARKKGKLPGATLGVDYDLEYGTDRLELHVGAVLPGHRAFIIDDLIATGGTALACVNLLRAAGADVVGAAFAIDLPDLGGADRLRAEGVLVDSLMAFGGH
ncbi:MAG: adenine phosphoribosyltransferase [Sphingomonadales bacterium]